MSRFARRVQRSVPTGAKLYITPASGSYSVGSTLTITIRESSGSTRVNAIQANLTYPTARLTFQSISTSSSPFTTTIESTGGSGNVRIGVGLLGDAVTGDQIVATVTFTVAATGNSAIAFAAGSGIADEATSSDICKQKIGGSYN